jgi:DNA-directed RNA polymerase specialized sigma subunit
LSYKSDLADLRRVGYARQRVERLADQLERAESVAYSITSHIRTDGTPSAHSGPPDRIAGAIVAMEALREQIAAAIEDHADVMRRVSSRLDSMSSDRHAHLLHLRYIDLLPWADVAEKLGVETASIYRMHRDALQGYSKAGGDRHA